MPGVRFPSGAAVRNFWASSFLRSDFANRNEKSPHGAQTPLEIPPYLHPETPFRRRGGSQLKGDCRRDFRAISAFAAAREGS